MYVISITHPSFPTQIDIAGGDKADCVKVLKLDYPDGKYKIIWEGFK
jgi:hypothetical protein